MDRTIPDLLKDDLVEIDEKLLKKLQETIV